MANYSDIRYEVTGTDVYTAISDLPLSGVDTGTQAFVSGNNRLYMWTGTGWYNIALINTNPSLSGAASSYSLSNEGANTVVTLSSTDPEGLPISFSVSHSGLGVGANAIATVTQSNNIFTFTPTTNTALAGTFTTTFTASDGVNVAVANSSFTLAFSVNNSNYTTALITSVGTNNQVNNTFVDSSPDNRTLTGYSGAHLTTFSPYRHAGYSTYFDGSGDYLSVPSQALGSGDYCYEFWVNHAASGTKVVVDWSNSPQIYTSGTTLYLYVDSANRISTTVEANQWTHIAIVRASGVTTLYNNGVAESTTYTDSNNYTNSTMTIGGRASNAANTLDGYVVDVRVVIGTAVYTSNFTPPTERLTAITNTSLLTCHLPYIADGSTNDHTITVNGDTTTEPFTPYEHEGYVDTDNGGSIKLSASGDYVGFSNSTDFDFTGDFTIAAWVYRTGSTGYDSIIAITDAGNDGLCSIGTDRLLLRTSGGGAIVDNSSYTIPTNRWTHVALTRSGSDIKLFLNGKVVVSATSTATISENNLSIEGRIGSRVNSANIGYLYANIADLYVKNGTADYTAEFTPPLTPASSTGTILHTKGTGAGIIDKSQSVKSLTLAGDTKSSTTQTKYLSSSMYFDEAGDTLTMTSDIPFFGSGDWTFEGWFYFTSVNKSDWQYIFDGRNNGSNYFAQESNNNWRWNSGSGAAIATGLTSSTFSNNTWYHLAVARESGTLRVFVDGTYTGGGADSSAYGTTNLVIAGRYASPPNNFGMYVQDLRFTNGLARYTANFTPPTAALQG